MGRITIMGHQTRIAMGNRTITLQGHQPQAAGVILELLREIKGCKAQIEPHRWAKGHYEEQGDDHA